MKVFALLLSILLLASTACAVTLTWDYPITPVEPGTSFKMYRQDNCTGPFNLVGTMSGSIQIYVDATIMTAGSKYCYQVTAANDTGESKPSNLLTFQVSPPATPSNLRGK